ncbi:hypothetical protein AXF42_Ash004002 [Apostasia shenzhenica]|uniref:Uncharacterized protein n=1 Tax=Apostasia shenzhenica TaxID=1088818 RepID=A0A2I0AII2_9ASPA|nr:hypothetical protein AXF42_Ash004002 [Apostasia shenzhenica]
MMTQSRITPALGREPSPSSSAPFDSLLDGSPPLTFLPLACCGRSPWRSALSPTGHQSSSIFDEDLVVDNQFAISASSTVFYVSPTSRSPIFITFPFVAIANGKPLQTSKDGIGL